MGLIPRIQRLSAPYSDHTWSRCMHTVQAHTARCMRTAYRAIHHTTIQPALWRSCCGPFSAPCAGSHIGRELRAAGATRRPSVAARADRVVQRAAGRAPRFLQQLQQIWCLFCTSAACAARCISANSRKLCSSPTCATRRPAVVREHFCTSCRCSHGARARGRGECARAVHPRIAIQ